MIRLDREGDLWIVTLDRPLKANALTPDMLARLDAIFAEAEGQAKALILTGEGRVFSAGADLDEAKNGLVTDPVWERLSGRLAGLSCVTIAALNGTLAGGAFGMALACDFRIAVPEARFFYPVMKLGYLPPRPDPGRLTALIGPARAKMILLAGQRIDAEEALSWGLIERIVPREALLDHARDLASAALAASTNHGAAIKSLVVQS